MQKYKSLKPHVRNRPQHFLPSPKYRWNSGSRRRSQERAAATNSKQTEGTSSGGKSSNGTGHSKVAIRKQTSSGSSHEHYGWQHEETTHGGGDCQLRTFLRLELNAAVGNRTRFRQASHTPEVGVHPTRARSTHHDEPRRRRLCRRWPVRRQHTGHGKPTAAVSFTVGPVKAWGPEVCRLSQRLQRRPRGRSGGGRRAGAGEKAVDFGNHRVQPVLAGRRRQVYTRLLRALRSRVRSCVCERSRRAVELTRFVRRFWSCAHLFSLCLKLVVFGDAQQLEVRNALSSR